LKSIATKGGRSETIFHDKASGKARRRDAIDRSPPESVRGTSPIGRTCYTTNLGNPAMDRASGSEDESLSSALNSFGPDMNLTYVEAVSIPSCRRLLHPRGAALNRCRAQRHEF
jgi:hypothetical protein